MFFASQLGAVLAAEVPSRALKALEFEFPESTVGRVLLVVGPLALIGWMVYLNIIDTRALWRRSTASLLATGWLVLLRLAVIVGIVVIAINPQERTRTTAFRRSRVAVLVDTSLSQRYPADDVAGAPGSVGTTAPGPTRAEAVADVFANTPFFERLRKHHDISLYTFDAMLSPQPFALITEEAISSNPAPGEAEQPSESDQGASATPNASGNAIDWAEALRPRGVETRLGEAVLNAVRDLNGQTLSAIFVVSDGGSNAGVDPATAHDSARNAKPPVRIVTVGVGGTAQPVNLHIASVQAPTDVHVGDPYDFSVFVQGEGLAGRTVEVELLTKPEGSNEQPVAIESTDEFPNPREVSLRENGTPVEVKFQRRPTVAGTVEYFVRATVKGDARELSQDDNERRKTIRVTDRKTRVLLLAGGPTRDYRFVRNMLFRHKGIEVDVLLQTVEADSAARVSQESKNLLVAFPKTAAELFEYDVVIGFDPDWSQLSPEQIKFFNEWVGTHAGGLILLAGDVYTPELAGSSEAMEPIRELYPVFLSSYLLSQRGDSVTSQAWPISWTTEGSNAGFLQLNEETETANNAWKQFPGVYRCYPTGGARAGATVYGLFSDPRAQTEYGLPVLLATQYYGAGRTMYIGSPEIWRLRMLDDRFYDRFWTKAIREVGQGRMQRGNSRGMLLLERTQYVLGQTVRLRASLLTPQLAPYQAESVRAEVFEPSGKPMIPPRLLLPDKNRPGQFAGDFRANLPGTYRIDVTIPETREVLSGKVDVVLPNLESDDPRQNVKLMTDLARDTGGRYIPLSELSAMFKESTSLVQSRQQASQKGDATEADRLTKQLDEVNQKLDAQLAELLPNRGEEFVVDERLRTLWDRTWVLYLLVGLLSAEWLTRKLLKLA
jgi:hypothetical protein